MHAMHAGPTSAQLLAPTCLPAPSSLFTPTVVLVTCLDKADGSVSSFAFIPFVTANRFSTVP